MRSSIASGLGGLSAVIALAACTVALSFQAVAQSLPRVETAPRAPAAVPGTRPPADPILSPSATPMQSDPRRVATIVEQATRLQNEGRRADALVLLERGLQQAPRDPQLRFLYGVAMADEGRTDDAVAVFEQLVADYPELPESYNNLAVLHAAAGDLDKARAALENAVRALPGYGLAHENLGDLYVRMAARAYERAANASSRSEGARAKLALARELIARLAPQPAAARGS